MTEEHATQPTAECGVMKVAHVSQPTVRDVMTKDRATQLERV